MIVNRLLDAFFRTLDAVDAVRDRVDRVLGREPRPDPWAVEWPPADVDGKQRADGEHARREPTKENGATQRATPSRKATETHDAPKARETTKPAADETTAKTSAAKPAAKKAASKAKKNGAKAKAGNGERAASKAKSSRKGSVDRSGKDFDSPRAKAIWEYLSENQLGVVTEEAMLDGKKVLARVLWALSAAEAAGSELGLTTADASALLHLAADMEVYATNIGRACRDHEELIEESEPDGRSKRYRLTPKGKSLAVDIPTEKR